MPNLSLRDLDTATLSRIKSAARRQKRSVNRMIVETLQQHYAAGQRPPDGVDALAGTWSKAELAEFTAAIAPFGEIDQALWVAEPKMEYRVKPVKAAGTAGGLARKRPAVARKTASK